MVGLAVAAVGEEGVAVEVEGFGAGELEGEEVFGEAGVVAGAGVAMVGIGDAVAVAGEGDFAPGAVGRVTFAVGFDIQFAATCGGDDDFGDAAGAAVTIDPGADEVVGGGAGWLGCDRGEECGDCDRLFEHDFRDSSFLEWVDVLGIGVGEWVYAGLEENAVMIFWVGYGVCPCALLRLTHLRRIVPDEYLSYS